MEYKHMDKIVNEICDSLINESKQWEIDVFTFNHKTKFNKTKFWISRPHSARTNAIEEQIFSWEQGQKIAKAFNICKEKIASVSQQKLLNSSIQKKKQKKQEKIPLKSEETNKLKIYNIICTIIIIYLLVLVLKG